MPTDRKEYDRQWYKAHKPQTRARRRLTRPAENHRLKDIVFQAYGGYFCSCRGCTEDNPKFMTLDHVENDGADHRREEGHKINGYALYRWIIKNDFPPTFRVMCWNCNSGRDKNEGVCPHHTFTATDRLFICQLTSFRNHLPL